MRVKHKESGKEYDVYKIEKEKSGTYILIWKEEEYTRIIKYKAGGEEGVEEKRTRMVWTWDDIDSYEPVPEIIYTGELKEAEVSISVKDRIKLAKKLKEDLINDLRLNNSNCK